MSELEKFNRVEINKFKIVSRVWKKQIFPKWLICSWVLISISIFILRLLSQNFSFIQIQWISFSSFIFPGVTGLSFAVTMLNATRNLFSTEDLVAMFNYCDSKDKDTLQKGDLFYRTITPYITASFLWLVISIFALISSLIDISFPFIVKEILNLFFYSLVIAGLLNLWFLVTVHLDDISIKVNDELDKLEE